LVARSNKPLTGPGLRALGLPFGWPLGNRASLGASFYGRQARHNAYPGPQYLYQYSSTP
jgi:hypothetical protein